jgi:hypothetical protein
VRGSVTQVESITTTIRVAEQYRGADAGSELRLNTTFVDRPAAGSACQISSLPGQLLYPGEDVLLFLVRDEFGLADWRIAAWGTGVLAIRDDRVAPYPGPALLSDVRDVARSLPALPVPTGEPPDSPAVAKASPGDGRWWLFSGIAAGAAALIACGTWLRHRGRSKAG